MYTKSAERELAYSGGRLYFEEHEDIWPLPLGMRIILTRGKMNNFDLTIEPALADEDGSDFQSVLDACDFADEMGEYIILVAIELSIGSGFPPLKCKTTAFVNSEMALLQIETAENEELLETLSAFVS